MSPRRSALVVAEPTTGHPQRGLAYLAAAIPVPVEAFGPARAYVDVVGEGPDHALYAPCAHRYRYRLYFALDGGRRRSPPVGPSFAQPSQACRLARLVNTAGRESGPDQPSNSHYCLACQGPLPAGSRRHRRTCSEACRQRVARAAKAAEQGARGSKASRIGSVTPAAVSGGPAPLAFDLPLQQEAAPAIGRPGAARSEVRNAVATPTT